MNYERIKELEMMTDEFNRKMEDAYKNYEKKVNLELKKATQSPNRAKKEKKKTFENIFKEPSPWKPNNYYGDYLEKDFKKLNPKDLNAWEIHRINFIKRTYTKDIELPQKRNFSYTNSVGKEFGCQRDLNHLSDVGRSIVSKFINENEIRERKLKEKEEEIEDYKYSKPPVNYNKWKFSNHIVEEFSKVPADEIHSFKKHPKPKYLIKEPFRKPKDFGDYFDKSVKLL